MMASKDGDIARNIQKYRERKGLSQGQLAELAGVSTRQIGRYEVGDAEPPASTFLKIADALDTSAAELGGAVPIGPDLGGEWWYAGQSWKDDIHRLDIGPVHIKQEGDYLILAGDQAQEDAIAAGDYGWRGELRLHRGTNTLLGWYESADEATNTAGTYFFNLHVQGTHAIGIWAGDDYDGPVVVGWCVLARTKELATQQIEAVLAAISHSDNETGNLRSWPKTI